jgi:TRAP-type transport system periplasmic protein
MKRRLYLLRAIVAGLTFAGAGASSVWAQDKITFRLAHGTSPQSSYSKAAKFFDKRLQELTGGRIAIREFGGGTLGTETSTLDLYAAGDLDMGFHFTSAMAPAVPQYGLLDVPFLFASMDHWKKIAFSPQFRAALDSYITNKPYQIAVVGLSGARNIYSKDRKLETFEALQGMKLRVPESAVAAKVWRAVGAVPTTIPWTDVYSAIETGVVSGAENTPNWYIDARHIEVAKQYNWTNHLIGTSLLLIGKESVKKIPADLKDEFEKALTDTSAFWLKTQEDADNTSVTQFDKARVNQVRVPPEVMNQIRARVEPLARETAESLGAQELLKVLSQKE